jgi:hypothetical protein
LTFCNGRARQRQPRYGNCLYGTGWLRLCAKKSFVGGSDRDIGITFSLQARFSDRGSIDMPIRFALAAFALIVLLYPSERVAAAACLPVMLIIAY